MPTYKNNNGFTIHTTYAIFYILRPFTSLYENWSDNIKKNKQERNIIELLNNIDNKEIQDDLRHLLFEQDYYVRCDIIRKYNNIDYLSNVYINEIINFSILKNKRYNNIKKI